MIELHDAEQSRALAAISPTGLGPVSRYGSMRLSELVDLYLDRHSAQWKLNTKQTNADRCKLSSVRLKVEQDQLVSGIGRFWRRAIRLQGACNLGLLEDRDRQDL